MKKWIFLIFRFQRVSFFNNVTRNKANVFRAQSVESAEEEEEDEVRGADWWTTEQIRRVEAGEREPVDRT